MSLTSCLFAQRITAIIPYYGYARQDRKTRPRVPISAALMARLIQSSGVDHVFAVDLHWSVAAHFFSCPRPCFPFFFFPPLWAPFGVGSLPLVYLSSPLPWRRGVLLLLLCVMASPAFPHA